jgi:hypothetical protein
MRLPTAGSPESQHVLLPIDEAAIQQRPDLPTGFDRQTRQVQRRQILLQRLCVLALFAELRVALIEGLLQSLRVCSQSLGLCPRPRDFLRHGSGVRVMPKRGPGPRERPRA